MKNIILSAFLLCLIFTQAFAQTGKDAVYKIYPQDSLKLNGKDKVFLNNPEFFKIDTKGNYYINDDQGVQIFKFSPKGEFVKKFGRKGSGPGEFETSGYLNLTPAGNIFYALPMIKKYALFSNKETFIKQNLYNTDYSLWLNNSFINETKIVSEIKLDDLVKKDNLVYLKMCIAIVDLNTYQKKVISDYLLTSINDMSKLFTNVVCTRSGKIFYGYQSIDDYIIFVYDTNGKELKKITAEMDKIKLTGKSRTEFEKRLERRKAAMKKLGLPEKDTSLPYYNKIACLNLDSEDNLWVITNYGKDNGKVYVKMYDKEGNYKKSFYLENELLAGQRDYIFEIQKGYLYAAIRNLNTGGNIYKYAIPKEIYSK